MKVPGRDETGSALGVGLVLTLLIAAGALVWALTIHRSLDEERAKVHEVEVAKDGVERARSLAVERARKQEEQLLELRGDQAVLLRTRERLERESEADRKALGRERSLRLAQLAVNEVERDPALALRLATTAIESADTGAARSALLAALAARREIAAFEAVTDMRLSPDESRLVIRSEGKLLRVDPSRARIVGEIAEVEDRGLMAFAPDGRTLVATTRGFRLAVIDLETFAVRHEIEVDSKVTDIDFDSNSARVLLGTEDRAAWLFDLESGERLEVYIGHEGVVLRALFVDDETVATFAADNVLRFFDAASGERLRQIQGSGLAGRTDILLARPARRLLMIDRGNRKIDVVDCERGEIVRSVDSGMQIVLDHDGKSLFRLDEGRHGISRLDLSGEGDWQSFHQEAPATVAHLSADGIVLRDDGRLRALPLRADDLRRLSLLPGEDSAQLESFLVARDGSFSAWGPGRIEHVAVDGRKTSIALGKIRPQNVTYLPRSGHFLVHDQEGRLAILALGGSFAPTLVEPAADGVAGARPLLWTASERDLALVATPGGGGSLLRISTGEIIHEFVEPKLALSGAAFAARAPLLLLCFTPTAPRLLGAGDASLGATLSPITVTDEEARAARFQVFDLDRGERLHDEELQGLDIAVPGWPGPDISPDGRFLLLLTGDGVLLRSWKDRSLEHRIWAWSTRRTARFSGKDPLVLLSSGAGAVLHDSITGEELRTFEVPSASAGTDFSPDEKLVITQEFRGSIRLWDRGTGKLRYWWGEAADPLAFLGASPDSKSLVAAHFDGLRIYDTASGERRRQIATRARVRRAVWSRDATVIALAYEGEGGFEVFEAASGRSVFGLSTTPVLDLAFDAAGDNLLLLRPDGALLRLPLDPRALFGGKPEGLSAAEREHYQLPPEPGAK